MAYVATEIAIVGGGVIGLSIAYRMATAGSTVTVFDAGFPGQASRAAAGMLAPLAESNALPALTELGIPSLRRYPAFLAEIADASGVDIRLCGPGILRVAATDQEAEYLCATMDRPFTPLPQPLSPPGKGESDSAPEWGDAAVRLSSGIAASETLSERVPVAPDDSIPHPNPLLGKEREPEFPVHLLTASEARAIEPSLAPDIRLAIHSPSEKHVAPLILLDALRRACERAGVQFVSGTVRSLRQSGSGWAVATNPTPHPNPLLGKEREPEDTHAGAVVVAAGAWTAALLGPLGVELPVAPLKGQICSVRFASPSPLQGKGSKIGLEHTIYANGTYIVPRPTGEIVIGATEEPDAGFNLDNTEDAIRGLRDRAARVIPALADATLESARFGFRPASPDRLPMIGKLPGCENGYVASGHGRNGILLTPITADIVRDMIVEGIPPPPSVDPARFTHLRA